MSGELSIDPRLVQVPTSIIEVLDTGDQEGVPGDLNTEKLIEVAKKIGSVGLTIESIASAGLIISQETAQAIHAQLDSDKEEQVETESRKSNLNNAIKRREYTEKAVESAHQTYNQNYLSERKTDLGRIVPVRDTDKINDLFDETEQHDNHPVLAILDSLRGKLNAESELQRIEAVAIARLLFTNQVKIIPDEVSSAA